MSDAVTMPTGVPVEDYIAGLAPGRRRDECPPMLALMHRATSLSPAMWGPTIIGYGRYAYHYESGRKGIAQMTGFSPRKAAMVVYVIPGFGGFSEKLARLGPHEHSVSCLYIKRLDAVDLGVLEDIVSTAFSQMQAKYPDWRPD